MSQLRLDLVSPEQLILSRNVEMVVMPGTAGYVGVMAEHAPMATSLKPGIIGVFEDGKLKERLFVPGGFAEINNDVCTILADDVTSFADMNQEQMKKTLAELESDKDEVDGPYANKLREMLQALEGAEGLYQQ